MPWREDHTFYAVLVSELMLQQTQVERVKKKFSEFMQCFPTIEALADAPLGDVLVVWQGLGYNRRAKYLHDAAQAIIDTAVPTTYEQLVALPGVGANTAGAILAYCYNRPSVFIETNIRTVYIYHFFHNRDDVDDKELRELVKSTIEQDHPRQWYYALMDYGAYLKTQVSNINRSRHYKKQSPLVGSLREMRGMIIRELSAHGWQRDAFWQTLSCDERFETACRGLIADGLIERSAGELRLTGKDQ